MDMPEQGWELDELETVKSVLHLYRTHLEKLEEDGHVRYVSREEYVRVTKSLVHCLDTSVRQTERMMDCIERIVDSLSGLSVEVAELKSRMDGEDMQEF